MALTAMDIVLQGTRVGDRIRYGGVPRSVINWVKRIVSATELEIGTYHRPSRGFARHRRRQKARGR